MLFQLGGLQIDQGFNAHETSRDAAADFAAKDLLGTRKSREFVGEGDDKFTLTGELFPHRLGGLDELGTLDAMRASGQPQILVRGDGSNLGWWLIENVTEKSKFLDRSGVGRHIEVEIKLVKTSAPDAGSFASFVLGLL